MSLNGVVNKKRGKGSLSFVGFSSHDRIFLHYWFYLTLLEIYGFGQIERKTTRFFWEF